VTIVLEGALQHSNSLGYSHKLTAGAVQHIVAGRGIFVAEWGEWSGIELWFSTAEKRMAAPAYMCKEDADIPEIYSPSTKIRVLVGTYMQEASPFPVGNDALILHINLKTMCT
jgi:redox-sensitive bicupin YhaK (pirin superfamily)